jgi:ABC-type transport system substrate-binding protein
VDRLLELGEVMQDKEEREKIYQQIHQLIYADQPACFLYFPFVFHAISSRFENTDEFFTVNMPTYTMKEWFNSSKKGGERDGDY